MALHRVYQPALDPALLAPGAAVEIDADEARRAAAVKRIRVGEHIEIFNGRGLVALARIVSVSRRAVGAQVAASSIVPPLRPEVIIACPPPKGPRAEMMIDQLSQAGVSRLAPLITERSVVEPRGSRIDKWRTITAVESARQCGRAWLMEIDEPAPLADCLEAHRTLRIFVADARGTTPGDAMTPFDAGRTVLLLVGPEGGFSDAEREIIDAAGAERMTLGPHILRLETAAVIGAGLILNAKPIGA